VTRLELGTKGERGETNQSGALTLIRTSWDSSMRVKFFTKAWSFSASVFVLGWGWGYVDWGAVSGLRFELGTRRKDGTYLTRTYTC
jgi:hypothetical protein